MAYIKCLRNVISSTVPDGKTVTPTDVVATWLACGSRTEGYTTLSAVIADSTCLNALMASGNAVDYLVRSTTFASDITSDSGAMTAIGLNNYCANTLLSNSTWCEAICNSTYFESVLNVKVPEMTSATDPSGSVSSSGDYDVYHPNYLAFDGDDTTDWQSNVNDTSTQWVQYQFTNNVKIYKFGIYPPQVSGSYFREYKGKLQHSIDGSTFIDSGSEITIPAASSWGYGLSDGSSASWWRMQTTQNNFTQSNANRTILNSIQFYGRADV